MINISYKEANFLRKLYIANEERKAKVEVEQRITKAIKMAANNGKDYTCIIWIENKYFNDIINQLAKKGFKKVEYDMESCTLTQKVGLRIYIN